MSKDGDHVGCVPHCRPSHDARGNSTNLNQTNRRNMFHVLAQKLKSQGWKCLLHFSATLLTLESQADEWCNHRSLETSNVNKASYQMRLTLSSSRIPWKYEFAIMCSTSSLSILYYNTLDCPSFLLISKACYYPIEGHILDSLCYTLESDSAPLLCRIRASWDTRTLFSLSRHLPWFASDFGKVLRQAVRWEEASYVMTWDLERNVIPWSLLTCVGTKESDTIGTSGNIAIWGMSSWIIARLSVENIDYYQAFQVINSGQATTCLLIASRKIL